jgi:hypothetical protein
MFEARLSGLGSFPAVGTALNGGLAAGCGIITDGMALNALDGIPQSHPPAAAPVARNGHRP